jgi:hypothetical protein
LVARPKSKEPAPLRTVLMKHLAARPKSKEPAPLRTVLMTLGCPAEVERAVRPSELTWLIISVREQKRWFEKKGESGGARQ